MNKEFLISVVIPIYNVGHYLGRTLESVRTQSYNSWECIMVDDGSTDESANVCKRYLELDYRFVYIKKSNGGVSSARNRGIRESKGLWLLFLDGDDILLPDALSTLSEGTNSGTINVVVGNFETVTLNGVIKRTNIKYSHIYKDPIKYLWYRDFYSRPGNTLIKKNVFNLINGYDESLSYNEDYEFTIRLLSIFSVRVIPDVVMKYNKVEDGASMKNHPLDKDFISKITFVSENSKWLKYIHYSLLRYALKRRLDTVEYYMIKEIVLQYSTIFKVRYFFSLIYRKARKLL